MEDLDLNAVLVDRFGGRRVLVTGHTGFKGSWLCAWLEMLDARVFGYALAPPTRPSAFQEMGVADLLEEDTQADVRDADALDAAFDRADPEFVFHLAAQSIVRESYRTPMETLATNVMGTAAVLDAVRRRGRPCVVVCVTSDKCYEPDPQGAPHAETDSLGGHDPYSASKGAAEVVIRSYRRSFFPTDALSRHGVRLASARAGNVIGGGDWAADRIVVDTVRAMSEGRPVAVRSPAAIRPWQHVLEPLSGYLSLGAALAEGERPELCDAFNFGPGSAGEHDVATLVASLHRAWGAGAREDTPVSDFHEAPVLRLDIDRAERMLGWRPRWDLDTAVDRTVEWYRAQLEGGSSLLKLTREQIAGYVASPRQGAHGIER